MDAPFQDAAAAFAGLKARFQAGEITRQEFVDAMKGLRLKDGQGRFWMIGAQSGRWYYFDGRDWIAAEPPSQKEKRAICVFCGFDSPLEAESCPRCGGAMGDDKSACPACGAALDKAGGPCPACGAAVAAPAGDAPRNPADPGVASVLLRAVHAPSFFLLGGGLGVFAGILSGAFAGATGSFSGWEALPRGFLNLQGTLLGAVIDALLGGVLGFAAGGAALFLAAAAANLVLSMTGGARVTVRAMGPAPAVDQAREPKADKKSFMLDLRS